jgi:hypothetical protein
MNDSKDHKAAAEPPLDCRVGRVYIAEGCAWQEDEVGVWDTACGERFEVMEGTPHENGMAFCPYCGNPLEQRLYKVPNA